MAFADYTLQSAVAAGETCRDAGWIFDHYEECHEE
jgi:hypothetical protein